MTFLKSAHPSSNGPTAAVSTSSPPVSGSLSVARFATITGTCFVAFVLVILIAPWIGTNGITFHNVVVGINPDRDIFLIARLPRVLFGGLTGGALAIAGVLFQAILRNSLACPFTLGVSSNSSLDAMVTIWIGVGVVFLGIPAITLAAFAGALLTIALVFFIARTSSALPTFTLLLAGVTLNFVFYALILFVLFTANVQQSYVIVRWMMGSLGDAPDVASTIRTAPFVLAGLALLI